MGEIETFVSRAGNYTDWHTDFQENFTIQLKGAKTWKLKRSGLEAPLLGFTPHYKNSGNLEMQQKVHLAYNKVNMSDQYDRTKLDKECSQVTLYEGDILYHPAGIWHAVTSDTDSISINFSLKGMRMAEFVCSAIQGNLFQLLNQRQFLSFRDPQDLSLVLKSAFKQAEHACKWYQTNTANLVPQGLMLPRAIHFNLDKPLQHQTAQDVSQTLSVKDN